MPGSPRPERRADLDAMFAAKTCESCGHPFWVVGSSLAGYPTCFPCMLGETDCSKDYEVEV